MTETTRRPRGTAQYARLSVAGSALLGLMLATLGGGLVAQDAKQVHELGRLSLESTEVVFGILLFGLGGLFLVVSAVALGVSLGLSLLER